MNSVSDEVKSKYRCRVLECRLKAGIKSQKDLAKLTGISASILSDLECGKLFLSSSYALILAETLGCSMDDLYEKKDSILCESKGD